MVLAAIPEELNMEIINTIAQEALVDMGIFAPSAAAAAAGYGSARYYAQHHNSTSSESETISGSSSLNIPSTHFFDRFCCCILDCIIML